MRRDDDWQSNITHGSASMRGRRESDRDRPGIGKPLLAFTARQRHERQCVILPGSCRLSKPADYCHSNKYPLWVSAIDENARSLRPGFCRVNQGTARCWGNCGVLQEGFSLRIHGEIEGLSRAGSLPQGDLCRPFHSGRASLLAMVARRAPKISWQSPATSPPPSGHARDACHAHTANRRFHPHGSAGSTARYRSGHGLPGRSPACRGRPCSARR